MKEIHLVPQGELHDHEDCRCLPRTQLISGFKRIIHNAFDRRDKLEAFGIEGDGWDIIEVRHEK